MCHIEATWKLSVTYTVLFICHIYCSVYLSHILFCLSGRDICSQFCSRPLTYKWQNKLKLRLCPFTRIIRKSNKTSSPSCIICILYTKNNRKKYRIRETRNLLTDADSSANIFFFFCRRRLVAVKETFVQKIYIL